MTSKVKKLTEGKWVNLFERDGYIFASRSQDGLPKDKPDAVCIVGITDDDKLVCIEQYRHSVDCIELSLPAGLIEANESALEAAKRELLEETGYEFSSTDTRVSINFTPSSGMSNEKICFVIADVKKSENESTIDENEKISKVLELTKDELVQRMKNRDNLTLTLYSALLMLEAAGL